jgi:photosystem II stability/assembly factor-like uncharacterized protein
VRAMKSQLAAPHLVLIVCASAALAQGPATGTAPQGPQLASPLFSDIRWRSIGPASIGGRVNDIVVARVRGQPDQIYIAASGGGVFKSANGGTSWTPVFDGMHAMMAMGRLAAAPSNPNIIWAGTGEATNPSYRWGDGVYKSTDAGRSWTSMGLADTRHVGRIAIHPTNPDIVFVAAQGHMWGPNTERGLFKSTNGGLSWKKVLYVDENTGANDVRIDPSNPQVLYATTYQRQRLGFGGIPTGPGSGLYRSTDGGESWTKLTRGLPTGEMGRIGLSISAMDPKLVYADIEVSGAVYPGGTGTPGDCPPPGGGRGSVRGGFESGAGGAYRSLDGGDSWEQVDSRIDQPSGYFNQVRADPTDRNRVYRLGTGVSVSDDIGKTWRSFPTRLHGDNHDLWIDPENSSHLIVANDGGVGISWDRGASWDYRNNIPISQFYESGIDNRDPFVVCGGNQDNGDWCVPSAVRNRNGIINGDSWTVAGGDGMHVRVDPFDTTYALFEVQSGAGNQGNMQRLNAVTLQRQTIKPGAGRPVSCLSPAAPAAGRGGAENPPNRWGWDTPILFSSVTPGVVYTAAQYLFRSTDRGGSWRAISPDLTAKVDRDTIYIMGKRLGAANYSPNGTMVTDPTVTTRFGQITTIGESHLNPRVLYTGSEEGVVQVTRDGGATWTNVTSRIPGLPPFLYAGSVVPSRFVAGRVYATFDGHYRNDDRAYVYVSDDFGQSWRAITTGLPTAPVSRLTEHPHDARFLVVGHVRGVHFSNDGGATWQSLNTNMPTVSVTGVIIHPRDNSLVAGTFGRGIWILDDVGPLQALTAEGVKRDALLASITRGRQWNLFSRGPTYGDGTFYGPNPEFDPVISYYVRDGAPGRAEIAISDALGTRVRALQGPAARGLNRVTWDMHMDSAIPGDAVAGVGRGGRAGGGGRGGINTSGGPLVLPGKYTVSIRIPGISQELRGDLIVSGDPMETFSMADRRARQDALLDVYGLQKTLVALRSSARTLAIQVDSIKQIVIRSGQGAGAAPADALADTLQRLSAEGDRLLGISGGLLRAMEGFNTAPTADQRQQITWAFADATRAVAILNRFSRTEIPAMYSRYANGVRPGVVPVVAPPVRKP